VKSQQVSIEEGSNDTVVSIGNDAALLSATEVGLGSLLHGFRIPLSGQFLSLNQIFLLTFSLRRLRSKREQWPRLAPMTISNVAALLKSLAPAGKKLTPMLAISMQGFLFGIGTISLGRNLLGCLLGAVLSSLWAFAQPLLLYLIIFGKSLLDVAMYFVEKLSELMPVSIEQIQMALSVMIALKIVIATIIVLIAWYLPESWINRYQKKMLKMPLKIRATSTSPLKGALKDILHPIFLTSLGLSALFFYASDTSWSKLVILVARPLVVAFVLFYLLRVIPMDKLSSWLQRHGMHRLVNYWQQARNILRDI
jgi:hypothetical protein